MTRPEFQSYILFVAILAGLLGVVNLLRPHKRWLGGGAILLGIAAMLFRQGVPMPFVAIACVLAAVCMGKDVGTRVGQPKRRGKA